MQNNQFRKTLAIRQIIDLDLDYRKLMTFVGILIAKKVIPYRKKEHVKKRIVFAHNIIILMDCDDDLLK